MPSALARGYFLRLMNKHNPLSSYTKPAGLIVGRARTVSKVEGLREQRENIAGQP